MTTHAVRHFSSAARSAHGLVACVFAALVMTVAACPGAEIRVVSGGAPQQVVRALAADFEKQTGDAIHLSFGVVGAIQQRLTAGEKADVVFLPQPILDVIEKQKGFAPSVRTDLARVGVGVAVRRGATGPDISTVDSVRKLLLDARSVVWSDPKFTPTGIHMFRVIRELGIADAVAPKVIAKSAIDGGADLVAKGEVEVGFFLASEIRAVEGVTLVGLLPPDLQGYIVYAAAVPAYNASPGRALEFVKFLTDSSTRGAWQAAGFEMIDARRQN